MQSSNYFAILGYSPEEPQTSGAGSRSQQAAVPNTAAVTTFPAVSGHVTLSHSAAAAKSKASAMTTAPESAQAKSQAEVKKSSSKTGPPAAGAKSGRDKKDPGQKKACPHCNSADGKHQWATCELKTTPSLQGAKSDKPSPPAPDAVTTTPTEAVKAVKEELSREQKKVKEVDEGLLAAEISADVQAVTPQIVGQYWVQKEIVQRRHVAYSQWYLREESVKYLSRNYPEIQLLATSQQRRHPHPVLNLEREWAEGDAISILKRTLKRLSINIDAEHTIVDVGGNPSRHARLTYTQTRGKSIKDHVRSLIHSTNPVLSSADCLRSLNHKGDGHSCAHKAQNCDCVRPAAYLSVDSLYYLSPEDIACLCNRATSGVLVAVCHDFDDAFGSFGGGEATYQLLDADTVSMSVRGNNQAYVHSNLSWMRQNGYLLPNSAPGFPPHHLVWTKMETYANHSIYMFSVCKTEITIDPPLSIGLSPSLQNASYYGEVSLAGVFNEQGKSSVPGDILSLPGTRVWSWGPSVLVYQSDHNITMHCPKGAVAEAACWSMGRDRSPDNFKNLLAFMRHKMKNYNVPPELLDSSIFAASSLGFVRNVAFETSVLHGVIAPLMPVLAVHRDALAHKFKAVWTWKRAIALALASGSVIGSALGAIGSIAGPVPAVAATGALAAGASVYALAKWVQGVIAQPPHRQTPSSLAFPEYHADRSSLPARTTVIPIPSGLNLPATDPTTRVEDLTSPDRLDPSAKIAIVDPTINREVPDNGPLHPAAIVSTGSIPVVPSNSSWSAISAICERILKRGPMGRGEVDEELFTKVFRPWCFRNLEQLGLKKDSVKPVPFTEWNAHYPKAQQAMHIKALEAVGFGNFNERLVDERGMFTKIESLPKSTVDGVPKLCPRGIQSGTPHHNVATGPFCKAFSKLLATAWSVDKASGPMYTSGASADRIGAMYDAATSKLAGNLGILEGDFARFDSTVHRLFLELEADIYKYVGCSEQAYRAFLSAISTFGRDKFGTKFSVDGGRHSGDHNTSCGNSLLQGLAILFCCALDECGRTSKLPDALEIIEKYSLALPVLGDDNLLIGDLNFINQIPLAGLLARLGLELEPQKHITENAKYFASFCSSRFYPCEDAVTGARCVVLGPGIGRGVAKSGWYVNPPAGVDLLRLVRADSIGRLQDNSFIPFLRFMWSKNHELTADVKQLYTSREMTRTNLHNAHVSKCYRANADTFAMVGIVYGLTEGQEAEYLDLLSQVKCLPCIVDYAPLHRAMVVDGVQSDSSQVYSIIPPVQETPSVDLQTLGLAVSAARVDLETDEEKHSPNRCAICHHIVCDCHVLPKDPAFFAASSEDEVELVPLLA
jgi:hypothetical protein